jgi:hypothetical protein
MVPKAESRECLLLPALEARRPFWSGFLGPRVFVSLNRSAITTASCC